MTPAYFQKKYDKLERSRAQSAASNARRRQKLYKKQLERLRIERDIILYVKSKTTSTTT